MAQFKVFLALASFLEIQDIEDINFIQVFLTFLFDNGLTSRTISTYVSAIKHYFVYYGLDYKVLEHNSITLLLRSFILNAPIKLRKQGIITLEILQNIISACKILPHPPLFRSIFLLAFFSFCRISNFAPISVSRFNKKVHFTRNDIVWGFPGGHLIIKWAKNMQDRSSHQVVCIPILKK